MALGISCLKRPTQPTPRPPRRRMLYHGPVEAVLPFFTPLGFDCPPRWVLPRFAAASTLSCQPALPCLLASVQVLSCC